MTPKIRITFALGLAVGLLALVASACSSLWRASPSQTPATQTPPTVDLQRVYSTRRIAGEPIIRVLLQDDADRVVIESSVRVLITSPGNEPDTAIVDTPIEITLDAGSWFVRSGGSPLRYDVANAGAAPSVRALTIKPVGDALLELDGTPLPGNIALVDDDGAIDVIERVGVESYLPGVIAKELFGSWHLETFKAQAIAARSYALHERARRRSIGSTFDVRSTTMDQAYMGATLNTTAHEAVRATTGLVLTYDNTILRTYYSSTVGGRAASAADTWPTAGDFAFNLAAPIQATPRSDLDDDNSPRHRWRVERTVDEVSRRLRAFGEDRGHGIKKLRTLRSVRAIEVNDFGRPRRYRVTDSAGNTYTLKAEDLRVAFNTSARGVPKIDAKTRVYSSDFTVTVTGQQVVVTGRGFGHGVGMSQYGAQKMAANGTRAEDILSYYYPGSELERAY